MKAFSLLFGSRKFILLLIVIVIALVGVFTHQPGFTLAGVFPWIAGGFGLLMAAIAHEDAAEKGGLKLRDILGQDTPETLDRPVVRALTGEVIGVSPAVIADKSDAP